MPHCDCTVVSSFDARDGVTSEVVLSALQPFLGQYDIELEADDEQDVSFSITDALEDSVVELQDGRLNLRLWCHCGGQDFMPDGIEELRLALGGLCESRGVLQICNQDTPADVDSTVMAVFFGKGEVEIKIAQIEYGLEQARPWLVPVLGQSEFDSLARRAFTRFSE